MILDRDRSPEIAAIEVEPARRLGLPNRADRAPGIDQRCVEPRKRSGRRIEPAVRDPDVVVCECDDFAFGRLDPGVQRARSTLPGLEQVAERYGKCGDVPFDDPARVVGGIVVDDNHIPTERWGNLHAREVYQGLVEQIRSVIRSDQDGGVERHAIRPSTGAVVEDATVRAGSWPSSIS